MEEAEGKSGTHSPARSLARSPNHPLSAHAKHKEEGFFATLGRIWGFSDPNPLRRSLVERISGAGAEISRVGSLFLEPLILVLMTRGDWFAEILTDASTVPVVINIYSVPLNNII